MINIITQGRRNRDEIRNKTLKPNQSPIYPKKIDPINIPRSIDPVKRPVSFPLMESGRPLIIREFSEGKRRPCPHPESIPAIARIISSFRKESIIRPIDMDANP